MPVQLLQPLLIEGLRLLGSLLAAIVGGGLVILSARISDRRKWQADEALQAQRERSLLTGMFAVRNHIAQRLQDYEKHGLVSGLERLRTAQSYVHRFCEATPSGSEMLMIATTDVGLKLDALLSTLDRRELDPALKDPKLFAAIITSEVNELIDVLSQYDVVVQSALSFVSEENLKRWSVPADFAQDGPTA